MTPEPSRTRRGLLAALATVGLIAVGVALALVLSRDGGGGSEAGPGAGLLPTAPVSVAVSSARATVTVSTTRAGTWPTGVSGWTIVVGTLAQKAHPRTAAERLAAAVKAPGLTARVLDSSQHPRLRPSVWIVYVGRYATRARAERAARQLRAAGVERGIVERLTG